MKRSLSVGSWMMIFQRTVYILVCQCDRNLCLVTFTFSLDSELSAEGVQGTEEQDVFMFTWMAVCQRRPLLP
jgi:hypothetical protein